MRVASTTMVRVAKRCAWPLSVMLSTTPSSAQGRIDIVEILGQFVGAETAEKECGAPIRDNEPIYQRNRLVVAAHAGEALKQRYPNLSEEALTQFKKEAIQGIVSRVSHAVQTSGCQSPEVQQLLKLYDMQSKFDLSKPIN